MPPSIPTLTKTFHTTVPPNIDPTNLSTAAKTILVTGGGRGIGKAIATSFALAGVQAIVILGRTAATLEAAAKEIADAGRSAGHEVTVRYFKVDITNGEAVAAVFKSLQEESISIDVLVNNAGAVDLRTLEASASKGTDYITAFDTNVKGTLHVIQSFLQFGLDPTAITPATFINISTIGLIMPTFPTWSQYVASKLAAFSLTTFMGVESGGKVRAFSIHPGRIETEMSKEVGMSIFDDAGM
jgi:NAD(P)-dependent dehydrogenase (short-subunit alcohol dehydrogenase family)